jgi:hypothetical protein
MEGHFPGGALPGVADVARGTDMPWPVSVVLRLVNPRTAAAACAAAFVLLGCPLAPPAGADATPPPGLERVAVPLPAWLASRPHSGPGSIEDLTHEPAAEQGLRDALRAAIAGDWPTAREAAARGGHELLALVDGARWYAVLQPADVRGLGPTVVVAPDPWRDLVAEAPHAGFERGTAEEVALLVAELGARAGLVAGAHRCAARARSPCSGTTRACGEAEDVPYRTSDAAHNPATLFHAAHEVLAAAWPEAVVFSLHGMRRTDDTLAIVSDGSREKRAGNHAVSGRLRDALRARLGGGPAAVSCNDAGDDRYPYRRLCGSTNVQGRSLNGSPDACGASADAPSGRFVHLEQTRDILFEFERGWAGRAEAEYPHLFAVLHAVRTVVPCTSADCPR